MLKTIMKTIDQWSIFSRVNYLNLGLLLALLVVSNNTLAQGQGSWGGGSGLFGILMMVLGIIFLIWMWMIHSLFKTTNISAKIRFFLVPAVACAPIAIMVLETEIESTAQDRRNEGMVTLRSSLREVAENYLVAKCQSDRKITSLISISSDDGLLIEGNLKEPPENIDLPKKPDLQNLPNFENMERGGKVSNVPKFYYSSQFLSPLDWTVLLYDEKREYIRLGIRFVEQENYGEMERTASFDWWRKHADEKLLSELLKDYGGGTHLKPNDAMKFRGTNSRARYVLKFRDISTREDRENWVARGRIRLFDVPNDKLVAEYVGFSHIDIPGSKYGPDTDKGWSQRNASCPNIESKYVNNGGFDAKNFFFNEVVQIKTNTGKEERAKFNQK